MRYPKIEQKPQPIWRHEVHVMIDQILGFKSTTTGQYASLDRAHHAQTLGRLAKDRLRQSQKSG